MRKTPDYIKACFTFSKRERVGLILLLLILALLISANLLIPRIITRQNPSDFSKFENEIDSLFVNDTASSKQFSAKHPLKWTKYPKTETVVELNEADSATLVKLQGIGPKLASRIVKYRNLLGGFYDKVQLKEIYSIEQKHFDVVSKQITVQASLIKGLSVDTASYWQLAHHPYIGKEKALQIIRYRNIKKPLMVASEDFINNNVFDSIEWQRVKPYLVFKN